MLRAGARANAAARVAWVVVGVVVITGVVGGIYRGFNGRPDWGDLRYESLYTWEHGHTAPGTAMFGYLPTTTFALWPFTAWVPNWIGVALFVASNLAATLVTIWILGRWWLRTEPRWEILVWPALLGCANLQHALQANQITLWTLVLCVGGLTLVGRGREWLGGLTLGLAAMLKVMPGVLGVYLLLRRRYRALGGMVLATVLFDVVPSVAVFGWDGAVAEHRAWLRHVGWHSNRHLIEQPLLRVHRHGTNSSLAAVLTRWLRALPECERQVILYGEPPAEVVAEYEANLGPGECLTLDPMPRRGTEWAEKRVDISWVPRFHVADWSPAVVWWIWVVLIGGGALGLAWLTWRSGAGGRENDWPIVGALWMLAMLWPSPMTRHYYLAWALPALVVVCQALVMARRQARGVGCNVLLVAGLVGWGVGVACLGSKLVRWYGVHLVVLAVLMAAVVMVWRKRNNVTTCRES